MTRVLLWVLLILTTGFVTLIVAATLTVDIPANDIPRVSKAFGSLYTLGHDANMQEVSYFTRLWIIDQTKLYEKNQQVKNVTVPPMDMQPSPTATATSTPTATATATEAASPTDTPTPGRTGRK